MKQPFASTWSANSDEKIVTLEHLGGIRVSNRLAKVLRRQRIETVDALLAIDLKAAESWAGFGRASTAELASVQRRLRGTR